MVDVGGERRYKRTIVWYSVLFIFAVKCFLFCPRQHCSTERLDQTFPYSTSITGVQVVQVTRDAGLCDVCFQIDLLQALVQM